MNQERGRRGCGPGIYKTTGEEEEEGHLQGKVFHCGELVHYATQCPRKKNKGEASNSNAALPKAEKEVETDDDCAMSAHTPLEWKWGDIEL